MANSNEIDIETFMKYCQIIDNKYLVKGKPKTRMDLRQHMEEGEAAERKHSSKQNIRQGSKEEFKSSQKAYKETNSLWGKTSRFCARQQICRPDPLQNNNSTSRLITITRFTRKRKQKMLLSKKEDILKRWKDLFKKVYNMEDSVNSNNTS